MWKHVLEPGRKQQTIWRMRIAFWIPTATKIVPEYVILIFFATTKMFARTRPDFTLYIICLFCYETLTF